MRMRKKYKMPKIKAAHIKQFENGVERLNKLLAKIQEYEPNANYYLAADNFNLLKGESHAADFEGTEQQENVVASVWMPNSGGGDW